jgi:PIN domain nuclease of toxin-antitoxin system
MIVLDTHALLWLAFEPEKLSKGAAKSIRNESAEGQLAIAAVTCWELALLCARKRIAYTGTIEQYVVRVTSRTNIVPITPAIAAAGAELPATFPNDPADRLIGATALILGVPLVTKDAAIRASRAVTTIW